MDPFSYYVVRCNECRKPNPVRPDWMSVPFSFIVECQCSHLYEYFAENIEPEALVFSHIALSELPRESQGRDLERLLMERGHSKNSRNEASLR